MGKSNKKKQVEQVYLEDHIGSWSQAFLTVRSMVWSMVEHVACQSDENDVNIFNNESSSLNDLGLPLSFGSSKSQKKRKQQQKDHETPGKRLRTHGKSRQKISLPILEDNGDKLIEHNIGFVYDECGNQKWFRVLGFAPDCCSNSSLEEKGSNQSQFMMTVRYLHTRDQIVLNRMDDRVHFAYHTSHETLAYQQAESDLWHSFNWDKPIDVHEKYWDQRYRIFRKFDEHVQLDGESWYSITYEQLAGYVVEKCKDLFESCAQRSSNGSLAASSSRLNLVLDCFSGCGGCTIPFAQLPDCHVLAVDMDEKKLKYLEHNCNIYGVGHKVECIQSDVWTLLNALANPIRLSKLNDKIDKFFYGVVQPPAINASAADSGVATSGGASHTNEVRNPALSGSSETMVPLRGVQMHSLSSKKVDLVVLSPPWGGPNYLEESAYDLSTMLTCGDGLKLVAAAASVADTVVYIVPRNTIDKQLTILANVLGCKYHIEDIYINNKCKVKVAYYGHFHR